MDKIIFSFFCSFKVICLEAGISTFNCITEESWFLPWRFHELHRSHHYTTSYTVLHYYYFHRLSFKAYPLIYQLLQHLSPNAFTALLHTSIWFQIIFLRLQSSDFSMKPQLIILIMFRIMVNWPFSHLVCVRLPLYYHFYLCGQHFRSLWTLDPSEIHLAPYFS